MKGFWILPVLFLTTAVSAGNKLVNVQGRLTNSGGTPLTGNQTVTFRLYSASTAPVASNVWMDTMTVSLSSGLFRSGFKNP